MLNINKSITGLEDLQKRIDLIKKFQALQNDSNFISFLKEKVLDALNDTINERLIGGTTNDEEITNYIQSNHIEDTDNGFILYNNCKIPANTNYTDNYPNGEFSIALAFEYGVGIVGSETGDPNAWEYNVHNYPNGWDYPSNDGTKHTEGYQGFEIYRYTADKVNKNLSSWLEEYTKRSD